MTTKAALRGESCLTVSHPRKACEKAHGVLKNQALLFWHYVCLTTDEECTCTQTSSAMHPRSLLSGEHFAGNHPQIQNLLSAAKHKGKKKFVLITVSYSIGIGCLCLLTI